jgi:large subunit ribosomal protein L5
MSNNLNSPPLEYKMYNSRFQEYYKKIISQDLLLKQNYTTIMQLPHIKKITLNTSSKQYISDKKFLIPALCAMEIISGRKAKYTYSKKSIASFKVRKNQILGCKVTLRHYSMFIFLEKLILLSLPRIRGFSGLIDKSFVASTFKSPQRLSKRVTNLSFGIDNLMTFPEIENHYESFQSVRGMTLTFTVFCVYPVDNLLLYSAFQLPLVGQKDRITSST